MILMLLQGRRTNNDSYLKNDVVLMDFALSLLGWSYRVFVVRIQREIPK